MCNIVPIMLKGIDINTPAKLHECNELAAIYELKSGKRFFFTDDKEADNWCKENGINIVMGSVACSICKKAVIDVTFKML